VAGTISAEVAAKRIARNCGFRAGQGRFDAIRVLVFMDLATPEVCELFDFEAANRKGVKSAGGGFLDRAVDGRR